MKREREDIREVDDGDTTLAHVVEQPFRLDISASGPDRKARVELIIAIACAGETATNVDKGFDGARACRLIVNLEPLLNAVLKPHRVKEDNVVSLNRSLSLESQ